MFDIILVALFLLMVYLGWSRGFVKAFIRFFGFFISSAIAYLSYKPVADWLMTTSLADRISSFIKEDVLSSEKASVILNMPLPSGMKSQVQNAVINGVDSAISSVTTAITTLFISIISMVLVFLLAFIVLKILEILLNGITKLPVLSFFNKVLGLIMGIINGGICVYLAVLLSYALVPFVPWLAEYSKQSIITNLIIK